MIQGLLDMLSSNPLIAFAFIAISTLNVVNAEQTNAKNTHQSAMQQGMALVQQKEWAKAEPYFPISLNYQHHKNIKL